MARYLITGRAGSGKTSVAVELLHRGFNALDSDQVMGLARWEDASGLPVTIEDHTNVDLHQYKWVWDKACLEALLATHKSVVLCGSADNDLALSGLFDRIFVLVVSPNIQSHRLMTRTNSDYGQSPAMVPKIVAEQRAHVTRALELGATAIDADQPLGNVVDQIVGYLD